VFCFWGFSEVESLVILPPQKKNPFGQFLLWQQMGESIVNVPKGFSGGFYFAKFVIF
jgi:hypothetical protein